MEPLDSINYGHGGHHLSEHGGAHGHGYPLFLAVVVDCQASEVQKKQQLF